MASGAASPPRASSVEELARQLTVLNPGREEVNAVLADPLASIGERTAVNRYELEGNIAAAGAALAVRLDELKVRLGMVEAKEEGAAEVLRQRVEQVTERGDGERDQTSRAPEVVGGSAGEGFSEGGTSAQEALGQF